jgi:hypothetical protein
VTLAIASSLAERPVRHDVAMTGEVTLRGKILEIGGVKEKILAAYRAGLRDVILPSGNERDLRDVPEDVREGMTFHFVDRMDEVFELACWTRASSGAGAGARGCAAASRAAGARPRTPRRRSGPGRSRRRSTRAPEGKRAAAPRMRGAAARSVGRRGYRRPTSPVSTGRASGTGRISTG